MICVPRLRWLNAQGQVVAISYPGKVAKPAVRVTVDLPDGPLLVVFQSRKNLNALDIGHTIAVSGNCVFETGTRVLYNPHYEIVK